MKLARFESRAAEVERKAIELGTALVELEGELDALDPQHVHQFIAEQVFKQWLWMAGEHVDYVIECMETAMRQIKGSKVSYDSDLPNHLKEGGLDG
jgi:hypothetical protein